MLCPALSAGIPLKVYISHTIRNHMIDGPDAIIEWFRDSALRPFLSEVDAETGAAFLATYQERLAAAYPAR